MTTPSPEEQLCELRLKAMGLQLSLDDLHAGMERLEAQIKQSSSATERQTNLPSPSFADAAAQASGAFAASMASNLPSQESDVAAFPPEIPQAAGWDVGHRPPNVVFHERTAAETELLIGRTWLNRTGAVVLLLGVAFFVKYSVDQGWIGPALRVLLAAFTGLLLMGAGELCLRRGMTGVTAGLMGCGLGILYVAAFGAYNLYHLVDSRVAMLLYAGVTVLSVTASLHANQLPIAVIGALGGFGTPIALNTGTNQQIALFSYILLLDIGLLFVAHLRRWDPLRFIAWIGTVLLVVGWLDKHYGPGALWPTWGFFFAFYLTFVLTAIGSLHRKRFSVHNAAGILIHLTNAVFFVATYRLWNRDAHDWLGLFAAALGLFQWLCAWRFVHDSKEGVFARRAFWTDGAAMFALFMPLQFDRHLVTMGWSVQAAVTLAFCRKYGDAWLRVKGAALFAVAIMHLFLFDWHDINLRGDLWRSAYGVITPCTFLFLFTVASLFVGAALLVRRRVAPDNDRAIASVGAIVATGLLLWLAAAQWERFAASWWWMGVTAVFLQVARRSSKVAPAVLLLLLACVAKFVLRDTLHSMGRYWMELEGVVLNRAVITGFLLAGLCLMVRSLGVNLLPPYSQSRMNSPVRGVLSALAACIIGWTGTFEILRVFLASAGRVPTRDELLAMHATLSVFWSLHAMGCLAVGFARRSPAVRYVGLALFTMTIVKLFFVDLAKLDTLYRIASFVALGGLLLLASMLYQWLSARLQEPAGAPAPHVDRS